MERGPSQLDLHLMDAKKNLALAQANVDLRQFKRATEALLRAMADITAADRITVEVHEAKKQKVFDVSLGPQPVKAGA